MKKVDVNMYVLKHYIISTTHLIQTKKKNPLQLTLLKKRKTKKKKQLHFVQFRILIFEIMLLMRRITLD